MKKESLCAVVKHVIDNLLNKCDTLIIGGTSLAVYPAAGLVRGFEGITAVINKSPTPADAFADVLVNESIGKALGEIVVR